MKLTLDAKIKVISKLAEDFVECVSTDSVPEVKTYKVLSFVEDRCVKQDARLAAFASIVPAPITKLAFDTRRVDQEGSRNPRKNLQYWHRSDQFIDKEDEVKLKTFAKLAKVLTRMKEQLGTSPEWFESYSRQLYDNVFRILRVKEADLDIFRPQVSYLEQLIFARYRLSMENLEKISELDLENKILSKDEELIGRSQYLRATGSEQHQLKSEAVFPIQGGVATQASLIDAIFGMGGIRKDGEKTVERTITIKLTENVIDDEIIK